MRWKKAKMCICDNSKGSILSKNSFKPPKSHMSEIYQRGKMCKKRALNIFAYWKATKAF